MIIIGYPGIGKSTLAKEMSEVVDLESSNFMINSKRDESWHLPYCNIAEDLSRQGKIVFVSSHKQVREQLYRGDEIVYIIRPSTTLRNEWIKKLKSRYEETKLEKDKRALDRAMEYYYDDIRDLANPCLDMVTIDTMDYKLSDIIEKLRIQNDNLG